jgi:hypothetical protein
MSGKLRFCLRLAVAYGWERNADPPSLKLRRDEKAELERSNRFSARRVLSVFREPIVELANGALEIDLRLPNRARECCGVEQFSQCVVRLGRVPLDFALKADRFADYFCELLDRLILAHADAGRASSPRRPAPRQAFPQLSWILAVGLTSDRSRWHIRRMEWECNL